MPHLPSAFEMLLFLAQLIIATTLLRLIAMRTHDTAFGRALSQVAP